VGYYTALIHKDPGSAWGVSFPDFPGCYGAADDSMDDAIEDATRALSFHAETMISDGQAMPKARSLEELQSDPDFVEDSENATIVAIPLILKAGRTKRISVTMDENTLEVIDQAARQRGITRAAFLAESGRKEAEQLSSQQSNEILPAQDRLVELLARIDQVANPSKDVLMEAERRWDPTTKKIEEMFQKFDESMRPYQELLRKLNTKPLLNVGDVFGDLLSPNRKT
jgi:predicted RNase H-like HicB family nuclease/uncharacterized protein (DUF1778 family)